MKVKLIIISIILLLVMVFTSGCIPFMEKIGLISPTSEDQLSPEKASPDGLVKVLIGFKEKPGAAQQAMVRGVGGKIKYTYHIVDAIAASIPEKAIDALQNNPNVRYVEPDGQVYADDELSDSWGVERIGAGVVHSFGNKGTGIKIAIIDTGIDDYHPDLNVVGGKSFVDYTANYSDDEGHGTHVAGTVAALDDGIGVIGVAPEASLYALKALDYNGSGYVRDIVAAIEWATDPNSDKDTSDRLDIINMSLGGGASITLEEACQSAYGMELLLVASAGNSGNPPGRGDNVGYPAAYDSVIAVAATDQNDKRAKWSSTGLAVELSAPGVAINSTLLGGGYGEKSGTSMASPHVAGVAALVIASGISDVRDRLQSTADYLGDSSLYGYGLVDADEAVNLSLDTGNIDGTVKDEDSVAIEGATVLVEGTDLSATTDAGGYYLLENIPVETYNVIASADGYYSKTTTVTILKDNTVTQIFSLQAIPTYLVSGTVIDAEDNILEGVTVTIEETGQLDTTGSDGTYAISDVNEDIYNFTAVKVGYSSQNKNVSVVGDTTVDFNLVKITEELQELKVNSIDMWYKSAGPNRFVSTKVEIVLSDGTAVVSGATVYLETTLPDSSKISGSGATADDGTITFEIKSRQTGTYTSTVTNVKKDGWTYDSDANSETSDSIDVE